MYERPPPAEPDRSLGERALSIAPLVALTSGGGVLSFLLLAYMTDPLNISLRVLVRMARNEQAVAAFATCCLAIAVWIFQRRGSNQRVLIGLRLLLLLSFAPLIFTMRR